MHSRVLEERSGPQRTHLVFFDPGEECVQGLAEYVRRGDIDVASFTAIGGLERTRLGFFNLETRGFDEIAFHEDQVEVLSLMGDILADDGEPNVHGHVVVGRRDGSTAGGHLLEGVVRPILIVTLVELSRQLHAHHH